VVQAKAQHAIDVIVALGNSGKHMLHGQTHRAILKNSRVIATDVVSMII
jgi:hypothetical protein